jgi:hypothetical protein
VNAYDIDSYSSLFFLSSCFFYFYRKRRKEKREGREEYDKTVNGDIDFNSPVNAYRSHCLFLKRDSYGVFR